MQCTVVTIATYSYSVEAMTEQQQIQMALNQSMGPAMVEEDGDYCLNAVISHLGETPTTGALLVGGTAAMCCYRTLRQ